MIEYLFIFLALIFFSIGVFIDNNLVNKVFASERSLLFYSSLTNLLFVPVVWIFGLPKLPDTSLIMPIILLGILEVLYLYPYFKALKEADTSVTVALFSLGKIFIPILAFFIVKEHLSIMQYLGFLLIISSAFMLTSKGLKINKVFWLMLATALILAIHSTVYKYNLEKIDWVSALTWTAIVSTLFNIVIGMTFYRKEIITSKKEYFKKFKDFLINEVATFTAMALMVYSYTLAPVTIVQGLLAIHPLIIMLMTYLGRNFFPNYFKENLSKGSIMKKLAWFSVMIAGIILTVM